MNLKLSMPAVVFIITAVLFFSCVPQNTSTDKTVIEVEKAFLAQKPLKASDYFTKINYIPLETTEESLIGARPIIQVTDKYIIVSALDKRCLMFDRTTGRFLCTIGHVGNDPGGYQSHYPVVDDFNQLLMFKGWKNDLCLYNFENEYKGNINLHSLGNGISPLLFFVTGKDYIAGYFTNITGDHSHHMLFFNNKGDSIGYLPNKLPSPTLEIKDIGVFTSEEFINVYQNNTGLLIVNGNDPDHGYMHNMDLKYFWKYNDRTYFKHEFNDTIYQVSGTQLIPDLTFDLGAYKWPYEERFNKKKDKNIHITQVLEGKDCLLFRFSTGFFKMKGHGKEEFNGIYNKTSGEVNINNLEKGISDDINNFLPVNPRAADNNGILAGIISPEDILDWIEEKGSLPQKLQHLQTLKEDDNPVLVLIE